MFNKEPSIALHFWPWKVEGEGQSRENAEIAASSKDQNVQILRAGMPAVRRAADFLV